MSRKDFIQLDKDIEKLIKLSEKSILKGYKSSLKSIKNEMAKLYEKYGVDGKLTDEVMNKYNRVRSLEQYILNDVSEVYKANNRVITSTLKNTFIHTSKSIISIVEKDIGLSLKPITKAIDVTKTINEPMKGLKWADRQGKHRADLIYDLQKTVKEGIASGDTYKTMASRLNKSMDISANKSLIITRTETARVMSQSQRDTLDRIDKAGVKMMKTWNAVGDERVRDSHIDMDGTIIPYDEDFVTPLGNSGFGPKLLDDNGEDSINCRCFLTISFE